MRLYNDPDFVNSVISAINERKLVLFIGAGFSKLCGLPLWSDLADRLIDACINDKDIELNYADKSLITKDKDSKTLITIAYFLHEKKGKTDIFNKCLYDFLTNLENDEETKTRRNKLINFVVKSGATVLTTNSDDILHECYIDNFIHYTIKDIVKFRMDNQRHLIHLHGYKGDMDSMVYTVKQYLYRYANEGFKRTIKSIFNSDSTILFIGYGLNEMQLLDFLVDQSETEKNRYILDGFFSHEDADFIAKQHYYSSFDLQLIAYQKDKNNYLALVDSVEYLISEAQSRSRLKPENYLLADSMLNIKPNNIITNSFNNTLMTLLDNEKKSVIKNIINSTYMSNWAYYLLKNDKFHFFNIEEWLNENSENKTTKKIDAFGFSLIAEVYKKEKNSLIYPLIKKMILDIINHPNIWNIINENQYIGRTLLSLAFSEKKFINNTIISDFILNNITTQSSLNEWISIILYEPSELVKSNKKSVLRINKKIIDHFSEDKYHSYELETYVSQIGNTLTELYPKEILTELNRRFRKISKNKYWSYGEIGSLISFIANKSNQRDDYESIILYWYLNALKNAESEFINSIFNQMIKSKYEIELKLAIYLLECNFGTLKNNFFKLNFNPFNIWELYSDLYVFIKNRWDDMELSEKELIRSNIDNMKIPLISYFYNQACKIDLINLIGSKFGETEYHERAILMKQSFSDDESDKYIQFSEPSLRNRRSWSSSYTITDDENFKQQLYNMSIDDFFYNISLELNDYQRHTVNSIYLDYFEKNNLVDWVISSSYENLDKIPRKYYNLLFQYFVNSTTITPFNIISASFSKILENTKDDDQVDLIRNFISDIYFSYIKKVNTEDDFKAIYLFIKYLYDKIDYSINLQKNVDKITIQTLLGHDIYQVISLLIRCAYNAKINEVIYIIDSKLNNLTFTPLLMSITCANIGYLWMIDNEWVKRNLDALFANEYHGQNLSILGFTLSQFHHPDFINFIQDKGLLDKIMNSTDFNENKWAFIHNILVNIKFYSNAEDILSLIATTSNNFGGIHSYFSEVSKISDLSKIEDNVNYICDKLAKFNPISEKMNGPLIVKLLHLYNKLKDTTFLWEFIKTLIAGHGTYYTNEIVKQLIITNIDNSRLVEFVELYVNSIDDHFYGFHDLVKLIDIPNWDGMQQKKDILINKIGEVNPEFWKLYNGNNHE